MIRFLKQTRSLIRAGTAFLILFLSLLANVQAQNDAQVRSILSKFKNWRYGNISLFKLDDETMRGVTQLLNPEPVMNEKAQKCSPSIQTQVEDKVAEIGCAITFDQLPTDPDIGKLIKGECIEYAKFVVARKQWECNTFKYAYVVTTRYSENQPFTVIALLTSRYDNPRKVLDRILGQVDVLTAVQLRQSGAPAGSPAKTLYEYLHNFVLQQNKTEGVNVTGEAQGLGDAIFSPPVYGLTGLISEDDTQQYMRISEGQAMDYLKSRELIVSPDLISYRSYTPPDTSVVQAGYVYNRNTPKFGLELRYGADPVNYPSFFSERLSLNAMWGVNRLGIILPWNGWSALGSSFGVERKLTYGGFGVNAAFDFPIKVTNSGTGVFNVAGSYVFSDAVESGHPPIKGVYSDTKIDTSSRVFGNRPDRTTERTSSGLSNKDILIRMNAQMHYTYAVAVDSGFFFRFRIGGAVYSYETWEKKEGNERVENFIYKYTINNGGKDTVVTKTLDTSSGRKPTSTAASSWMKADNRFIGGVSARLEFMATVGSTPYGIGIQYFDEAILADGWLMVPINPSFALRFEGRMFAPVLRDPRAWETTTVFVPTMRVIYNF